MGGGSGKRSRSRPMTPQFIFLRDFWDRRLSHFLQIRSTLHLNLARAIEFPVIP